MTVPPLRRASSFLTEVEHDCADHTFIVSVRHRRGKPTRRTAIIGGILRVLAENTDGFCAYRNATDDDLIRLGARFSFTSDAKRDEFIGRMRMYMDGASKRQLVVVKI